MTQYVNCEQARELLDGLIDRELSLADQLIVESHLRWCQTCALCLEDMRMIGASLRTRVTTPDHGAVAAISEAVLLRVRAEREQSFAFRLREMLIDSRLLWPALGATAAVAVCVAVAAGVLRASTAQAPQSLAAMIAALAEPGSDRHPLRPSSTGDPLRDVGLGISIPRVNVDDAWRTSGRLEDLPVEDVLYAGRFVVNRDGSTSNFELLLEQGQPRGAEYAGKERAVLDAIQQARFAPAQTPLGRAVAVDMVWVIAKTTAVVAPPPVTVAPRTKEVVKPPDVEPVSPVNQRSATPRASTTA